MDNNFINNKCRFSISRKCYYDSNVGYAADFTINGNYDGWTSYDGIYLYGCWSGVLFATLYGSSCYISRPTVFLPVDGSFYYTLKIVMKVDPNPERLAIGKYPTAGKIMWQTLSDQSWTSSKSMGFDVYADGEWHTYSLNMGEAQWWQGDINNLRLYPILDGFDGDKFFIKSIQIISNSNTQCINTGCSYFSNYTNNCGGVGRRGYVQSAKLNRVVFNIEEDVNDILLLNINDYGEVSIKLDTYGFMNGFDLAKVMTLATSRINIGGYSEVDFVYDELENKITIHSGVYSDDSSVVITCNNLSRYLMFFDDSNTEIHTSDIGLNCATGFIPLSSFQLSASQIYNLFDVNSNTNFQLKPLTYIVEGGRSDWLFPGSSSTSYTSVHSVGSANNDYSVIDNYGKTIIDFTHPISTSGRITKLYACCTLDSGRSIGRSESSRKFTELSGAKFKIFRPKKDGTLTLIHEVSVPNRDRSTGQLYSTTQESVDVDCDLLVNKGDLIGIYNANIYVGKSKYRDKVDAIYYHLDGDKIGNFDPGVLFGDGVGGLCLYTRGNHTQKKLVVDIDLGDRINLDHIIIDSYSYSGSVEYNVARCIDMSWQVDLFGLSHETHYCLITYPDCPTLTHPNTAYGINCLNDGIFTPKDGLAADSFTVGGDGTPGVMPVNPKYFWVNGDNEWINIYMHHEWFKDSVDYGGFDRDPIAFTATVPNHKKVTIHKSKVYFKELSNFRSFALSTYLGDYGVGGDADIPTYKLIPKYNSVTIDGIVYEYEGDDFDRVDKYLFTNPSVGHAETTVTSYWTSYADAISYYGVVGGTAGGGGGTIDNGDSLGQAARVDWYVIEHEWDPIECYGFRLYCFAHFSTKINEMELYSYTDALGAVSAAAIYISYSDYGDFWWPASVNQREDDSVEVVIKDSPRYLTLEVEPTTDMWLSDVYLYPSDGALFIGDKGCVSSMSMSSAPTGEYSAIEEVKIKNVYGDGHDLYVDIAGGSSDTKQTIYSVKMSDMDSIINPEIGPTSIVSKKDDYTLDNDQYNCAINCYCYGLKNLIDGKKAYYSKDDLITWDYFGLLYHDTSIDYSNSGVSVRKSVINIPVKYKSRYWRLGLLNTDASAYFYIKEIKAYYQGSEIVGDWYHDVTTTPYSYSATTLAPHISNGSLIGSYYKVNYNNCITFDSLDDNVIIDKLVIYSTDLPAVWKGKKIIDTYTKLYLKTSGIGGSNDIYDYSYYEHPIVIGSNLSVTTSGTVFGSGAIKFSGGYTSNDYITVPYNTCFGLRHSTSDTGITGYTRYNVRFSMDFFVRFYSLPTVGNRVVFARIWTGTNSTSTFRFSLYNDAGTYKFVIDYQLYDHFGAPIGGWPSAGYYTDSISASWTPSLHTNYFVSIANGGYNESTYDYTDGKTTSVFINGSAILDTPGNEQYTYYLVQTESTNLIIGEGLDGSIEDFIFCVSPYISDGIKRSNLHSCATRTYIYERFYDLSLYTSPDNVFYGKHSDLALFRDTNINTYHIDNLNCVLTNDYFAIDLGELYYVDIIRHYGSSDRLLVSSYNNIAYIDFNGDDVTKISDHLIYNDASILSYDFSGDDGFLQQYTISFSANEASGQTTLSVSTTSQLDPGVVLTLGPNADGETEEVTVNTVANSTTITLLSAITYSYLDGDPISFYRSTPNPDLWYVNNTSKVFIKNSTLYMSTTSSLIYAQSLQTIWGDFDVEVSALQVSMLGSYSECSFGLALISTIDNTTMYKMEKCSLHDDSLRAASKNSSGEYTDFFSKQNTSTNLRFRLVRNKDIITAYFSTSYTGSWVKAKEFYKCSTEDFYVRLFCQVYDYDSGTLTVNFFDFIVNSGYTSYSVDNTFRWVRLRLPNNGTTNYIRKIGIYPDITKVFTLNGTAYNCLWDSLGTSITTFNSGDNLALGSTISGSSYFGDLVPDNVVNGVIEEDIYSVWGTESSLPQELLIDIGEVKSIYRVKLYHGYNSIDSDTSHMITDYTLSVSEDDYSYTTIFSISSNASKVRTHDLSTPVEARYIKLTITDFVSDSIYLRTSNDFADYFKGAVLREIEVFEYYGFDSINSELYPIVAVNLRSQFNINGHSVVGIDAEATSTDWSNSDSEFTYSAYPHNNPSKIPFRAWGSSPGLDKWVVIKRNTATNYSSGPDYLKELIVKTTTQHNPCDYWWWWSSSLSSLSNSPPLAQQLYYSYRPLVVYYPSSSGVDTISFIEGDNFGTDIYAGWRDGFKFRWYIDDINELDTSKGEIYFGGYDYVLGNPVVYHWEMSTVVSGNNVSSGWNDIFLQFHDATDLVYTETGLLDHYDITAPKRILLKTIGLSFAGFGNKPINMYIDGFVIGRNYFETTVYNNDKGLYLVGDDCLTAPLGGINLQRGTVEFFLKPDYYFSGHDYFNDISNRGLFHIGNNSNDWLGMLLTVEGLIMYAGNPLDGVIKYKVDYVSDLFLIDQTIHIAFVFSSDGKIDSDGSSMRLYINNIPISSSSPTWVVRDSKYFTFVIGGKGPMSVKPSNYVNSSSVDGVVYGFKLHSYCKTDFSDSIIHGSAENKLMKPNDLIEISKDKLTFYKSGDENLPLFFDDTNLNQVIPIYFRTFIPKGMTGKESRTAGLLIQWKVGV